MSQPKKVLLVYYSQTGQLAHMADYLVAPLKNHKHIALECLAIEPETQFKFPWGFTDFFNTFPETVAGLPAPIKTPQFKHDHYDLVILAYTVWFLSPSQPTTAFLQHPKVGVLLKDTPVITLIGCRNMWLRAQEKTKTLLNQSQAKLIANIVKIDSCGGPLSFVATPLWMLTGKKQPAAFLPVAGISDQEQQTCTVFGEKIAQALANSTLDETTLQNMGAVYVNERLILSERFAERSFKIWGKGIRKVGTYSKFLRTLMIYVYVVFLLLIILTVVPISAIIKRLIAPLTKNTIKAQKEYFSWPSGE